MDYHFNLRQSTQKKFRMSPFLHAPTFERSFSTNPNADTCSTSKPAVKPMLNLFSDFHSSRAPLQKTNVMKGSSKIISPMTSFSSSSSMSVSYIVGGFVSSQNQSGSNSSKNICNLLDALVSSFQTRDPVNMQMKEMKKEAFPDTLHNYSSAELKVSTSNSSKSSMNPKRTYADVTKGILPKPNILQESELIPLKITNMNCEVNICSNSMVAMYTTNNCHMKNSNLLNMNSCTDHSSIFPISPETCSQVSVVNRHPCVKTCAELRTPIEDLISCNPLTQHGLLTLPISSSLDNPRINRTLSECSVDSDDSFVVFQSEEDTVCDSISEEDCPSDDDEFDNKKLPTCLLSLPSAKSNKKTKRVSFMPDEKLVKVHNIVTWNYAHRTARIGPWETFARDRERFEKRISQISEVLSPILQTSHRETVFRERFLEKN